MRKLVRRLKVIFFSGMIYRNVVAGGSRGSKCLPVVREDDPEPKVAHSKGREKYGH